MVYAVVQDVPASWEQYAQIAQAIGNPGPPGLILHVAGPTDEGFRTIEIWETREAWQRWSGSWPSPGVSNVSPWASPTLRVLSALTAVRGPDVGSPQGEDQRGVARPRDGDGNATARFDDAGAFE